MTRLFCSNLLNKNASFSMTPIMAHVNTINQLILVSSSSSSAILFSNNLVNAVYFLAEFLFRKLCFQNGKNIPLLTYKWLKRNSTLSIIHCLSCYLILELYNTRSLSICFIRRTQLSITDHILVQDIVWK